MHFVKLSPALKVLITCYLFSACGVSEKKEKSVKDTVQMVREDSSHQNLSLANGISIDKIDSPSKHEEAGFELLYPKHMQKVEPGEIHYKFNTQKFPFVNGHSVRVAIEGGVERHIYDADKKLTIENKGSYLSVAFLCDKYGISIKDEDTYQLTQLNVGVDEKREIDLKQPMIFLNLPHAREGKNVVIDYFVKNVTLQKGGDRVRVSIDEDIEFYLYEWSPYKINGLKPGKHKMLVELVNKDGENYVGPYTHDERDLEIQY